MEPPTGPKAEATISGASGQRAYHAYLLRLWQEHRDGQPVWRASLEDPHTGQRLGFAELTQLFAFLQRQAGGQAGTRPANIER